jgi:hypothetical protein
MRWVWSERKAAKARLEVLGDEGIVRAALGEFLGVTG